MTREEAIKIIEANCSCTESKLREACAMFIPELRESKDERMRKCLIHYLRGEEDECEFNIPDMLAYLEKQKEQKPVEKQDYSGLNDLERAIHRGFLVAGVENVPVIIIKETAKKCLAQMKPAEWSEEDERIKSCIGLALTDVDEQRFKDFGTTLKDCLAWLKSLRPSWKPSEEQMEALLWLVEYVAPSEKHIILIKNLYEQLKKL